MAQKKQKTKLTLIIIVCVILCGIVLLGVALSGNSVFRTLFRFTEYPDEIVPIEKNIVEIDLSKKPPARLAVGIKYPFGRDIEIVGSEPYSIKVYRNEKLINYSNLISTGRIYWNFRGLGYRVSRIHTFKWSRGILPNTIGRLVIDLDGDFKGLEIIIWDAGLD